MNDKRIFSYPFCDCDGKTVVKELKSEIADLNEIIINLEVANQQLQIDNAELDMISRQDYEIAKKRIAILETKENL